MNCVSIFDDIVRLRREGRKVALATIVRRVGSAPRKDSAKMLVLDDGSTIGSVGGGCVEAEVWGLAKEVLRTRKAKLAKFELNDDSAEEEGLVCGGTVEVFVEPILSDPRLIILGAGHLGKAVADIAQKVAFKVSVVDDRESFANRERFPDVDEVQLSEFSNAFESTSVDENSYVLVVTRGHKHDQAATEAAINTRARYVGLVGSRRKIKLIVEALLEKGLPAELFEKLYAPIGLDIGSETPEEIAVSVVAELIAVEKGVHVRSPKQQYSLGIARGHLVKQVDSNHQGPKITESS
jgi:xanthine dehydrogenase accessory factor